MPTDNNNVNGEGLSIVRSANRDDLMVPSCSKDFEGCTLVDDDVNDGTTVGLIGYELLVIIILTSA